MKVTINEPKPLPPPDKTYSLEVTKDQLACIAFACGNLDKTSIEGSWVLKNSGVDKKIVPGKCFEIYNILSGIIEGK